MLTDDANRKKALDMYRQQFETGLPLFQDINFRNWYDTLSRLKGLNSNPTDRQHYYDYIGYWKSIGSPDYFEDNKGGHFPDTFKLPGHPLFSNQSIYYKPGMENYIPVYRWEGSRRIQLPTDSTIQPYTLVPYLTPEVIKENRTSLLLMKKLKEIMPNTNIYIEPQEKREDNGALR